MTTSNQIDAKTEINLSAVRYEVVDTYLAKLGLPTSGGEYARLVRLHEAMQLVPNPKGTSLGGCSECRGKSDVRLACCPFCGEGAVDESVIQARGGVSAPAEDTAIEELKELLAKKAAADVAVKARDEAKTKEVAAAATAPPKQPLVPVPPGVGVRSRRAQKKAEQRTTPDASPADAGSVATVGDLDESVKKIKALWGQAAVTVYDLATLMYDVFERKLWMQRRGDGGNPLYTTFSQWVNAEMPFSHQYAYELTNLPKYFTRAEVEKFGATKLTLSLRISEEERKRLLESGDLERMSVRETKERITQNPATAPKNPERAANQAASTTAGTSEAPATRGKLSLHTAGTNTRKGAKATQQEKGKQQEEAERARPKVAPEPVTVVTCVLTTSTKFELFTRAKRQGDKPVRARSLADDPMGVIVCANGARIRVGFAVNSEGFIEGFATVESPSGAVDPDDDSEE
jgi:hypothetical protein